MSRRLTTNAGASFTSTQDFFRFLPTAKAVASAASSVFSPRMISTSGRTATGLKKWKPTTRSGCESPDAMVGDRQRGGVGGQHALRGHDRLDLGEHLLLDRHLLEHGLDDEVGVREHVLAQRAGDQAFSRDAWSAEPAAWPGACRSRRARSRRRSRPGPGRCRSARRAPRAGGRTARDLRGHQPGPDHADLRHRPGQRFVRGAGRAPGPLLGQVERVQAAPARRS